MKNLKKVLALVLVIAMVMGFAVSASATEFSDDESIAEQNATAVEVLTALNIINGYPDGTFRPEDTVTRAEVAKMIAVAFNGGDESINDLYANVVCGLTDIGGTWAEGYIKYCYATGIVDGYPDGTYRPDGEITGLEVCQIMLNILGYEIDTTNTPWATAVMAKSNTIGLLKNVSTAVGSACPRQETAQIIYNALTLPIQKANALGVLVDSDDTILSLYLGGSSEIVVVTGNEEAALNADEPLDEGKTEVDDSTVLAWSTTMDMIGSSYKVWTVGNTVIYAEDSGMNTIEEYTYDVASLSRVSDLKLTSAEHYINFDDEEATTYTADIRIRYAFFIPALTSYDIATLASYGYDTSDLDVGESLGSTTNVTITAESKITTDQMAILHYIFSDSAAEHENNYIGEVYIGTTNEDKTDVSDTMTYRNFVKSYVVTSDSTVTVSDNENGNYVKIVDNDGDGVADYILKTEYEMEVVRRATSSKYYLTGEGVVAASDVVTEDEIATGDIVLYAYIDGVYYTSVVEPVTVTIDRKGVDAEAETITCGDDVYGQSRITSIANSTYSKDITATTGGSSYDLYLDKYGYVRLYIEASYGNGFLLLTDGYFDTNYKTYNYAVEYYDADEDALVEVDVTNNAFIDDSDADNDANYGAWRNLKTANKTYSKVSGNFATNVATYLSGDAYTLYKADRNAAYDVYELAISSFSSVKDPSLLATTDDTYVQATTGTVYYLVTKNASNVVLDVETWTGYANAPSSVSLDKTSDIAYAVTIEADNDSTTNDYEVAQVIVIEQIASNTELTFLYRTTSDYGLVIGYDSDDAAYESSIQKSYLANATVMPDFYVGAVKVTDYAANYIYAATATTAIYDIYDNDYVNARAYSDTAKAKYTDYDFTSEDTPVFAIGASLDSSGNVEYYTVKGGIEVKEDDQLIIVCDSRGNVLYALDVTQSKGYLDDLYRNIYSAQTAVATTYTVTIDTLKVVTVEAGSTYTTPSATKDSVGSGYKMTQNGVVSYVEYGKDIEVNANTTLESGYVKFVIDGTTYPIAYSHAEEDANKTTDLSDITTGDYYVNAGSDWQNVKADANKINADSDRTVTSGLYKVVLGTLNDSSDVYSADGTVYDKDGNLLTAAQMANLSAGTYYATAGTTFTYQHDGANTLSYEVKGSSDTAVFEVASAADDNGAESTSVVSEDGDK